MPMAISRNGYLKTPKKRPKTTKNIEKRLQTSKTPKTPKMVKCFFRGARIANYFFFGGGRRASGEAAAAAGEIAIGIRR